MNKVTEFVGDLASGEIVKLEAAEIVTRTAAHFYLYEGPGAAIPAWLPIIIDWALAFHGRE